MIDIPFVTGAAERTEADVPASLQHRLRLFALGCGAAQATVAEQPGRGAELAVIAGDGTRLTVAINGPAWRWHQALDRMEELYDEKSDAGLCRFLGLKRAA